MHGKQIAIGVLVVLAVLLGGVVASALRAERAAYAQGGVFARYLAVSAEVQEGFVNFAVLDTQAKRVLFYDMSPPKYELVPTQGHRLDQQFQRSR